MIITCEYRALWAAVIEQAIIDLGDRGKRIRDSARRWFLIDDHFHLNSFVNLCGILDIHPSTIRAAILSGVDCSRLLKKAKRRAARKP